MNQLTKIIQKNEIQHLIDIFVACSDMNLHFWQNVMGQKLVK